MKLPKAFKTAKAIELRKTIISVVIFYSFFGFCIAMFLYRGGVEVWGKFPFVQNFLRDQHISNFALSGLLTQTAASYPAARRQYRIVGLIAVGVIALNLYVESGSHFANVPDPSDALAGIAGVVSALFTIWLIKIFGSYEPKS